MDLPWWSGLLILVADLTVECTIDAALGRLRREHRAVCRDTSKVTLAVTIVGELTVDLAWAVMWEIRPLLFGWAIFVALNSVSTLVNLVVERTSKGEFRSRNDLIQAWRLMRAHRDHDDDCEYGPKRRRGRAPARLPSWTKVAVNPAFSPT